MKPAEVLLRYRWLQLEAETLIQQAERVQRIGAPTGVAGQALSGMPHGTNDAEAARGQLFDGYIAQLRRKATELSKVCGAFESTLELLQSDRERVICRMYYGLGLTDAAIGKKLHLEERSINGIRNEALRRL